MTSPSDQEEAVVDRFLSASGVDFIPFTFREYVTIRKFGRDRLRVEVLASRLKLGWMGWRIPDGGDPFEPNEGEIPVLAVQSMDSPGAWQDAYEFDQGEKGWRSLPREGRAPAILRYLEVHGDRIPQSARPGACTIHPGLLWFHAGQCFALTGNTAEAVRCLSVSAGMEWGVDCWMAYVRATLAFMAGDRDAFDRERAAAGESNPELLREMSEKWGRPYA